MVGQTAELFQSETFKEQMNKIDMFYDFYAQKPDGTQTINILIQNLGLLYGTVMDEETFVDMSTKSLEAQLEDAGFSNISWEINTIDLGGQTRHGMLIQADVNGMTYQAQQAYIKVGSYIAVITLGDFTGEGPAALAELFSAA